MFKFFLVTGFLIVALAGPGCKTRSAAIEEISVGLHHNNELQIQLDVLTSQSTELYAEYWPDSLGMQHKKISTNSKNGFTHSLVLTDIFPKTKYTYQFVMMVAGERVTGKRYHFESRGFPLWLQDQFKYSCPDEKLIPRNFRDGFLLMNKRETPGLAYIVDYQGRLRWYHMVDGTGFKVAHFTKENTIISILGKNDEPTSYGSEILEINLLGDTLLHLKKGQNDFKETIHHEILKKNNNAVVTLFVDQRIMDLRKKGGLEKDTVNGDGILIMDSTGKKIWQWSVFEVMEPMADANLMKDKKDWMHANSLNYDIDSNFLVSFYNNGQIWKVDAKTGSVIWKLGKGGDVKISAGAVFDQAHAVHVNAAGSLMFFDNGVAKHQSEVFSFKMQDNKKSAIVDLHIPLPKEIYNDRMGSAYMVGDSNILVCSSKRHITVLTNRRGVLLWTLNTAIPPYRVQFIEANRLQPFISN